MTTNYSTTMTVIQKNNYLECFGYQEYSNNEFRPTFEKAKGRIESSKYDALEVFNGVPGMSDEEIYQVLRGMPTFTSKEYHTIKKEYHEYLAK